MVMLFIHLGNVYSFGKIDSGYFGNANCIVYSNDNDYYLALEFPNKSDRHTFVNRVHELLKENKVIDLDSCLTDLNYERIYSNLELTDEILPSYSNIINQKSIYLRFNDSISYFGNSDDLFNLEFDVNNKLTFKNNGLLNSIVVRDFSFENWDYLKTEMLYKLVMRNCLVLDFNSSYFHKNANLTRCQIIN